MSVATKEILDLNRFDASRAEGFPAELAQRVAKRQATFGASSVLFYEQPIEMVRAQGAYLYDAGGRRYLDVYNNVPSVGHCHPRVVEAVARQIGELNIHTRYLSRVVESYSEELLSKFPAALSNVVLTCTGSESNDLAMHRPHRNWRRRFRRHRSSLSRKYCAGDRDFPLVPTQAQARTLCSGHSGAGAP